MPKLTNISGVPRALPQNNGVHVEFAPGESKDFPDADYQAIAKRASVQADFSVEGEKPAKAPKKAEA